LSDCKAMFLTCAFSQQVVGRISKGHDILEKVNGMDCDEYDAPLDATRISSCGLTNAAGSHETLDEAAAAARRNETPQEAAARLESEAQVARDAVRWASPQSSPLSCGTLGNEVFFSFSRPGRKLPLFSSLQPGFLQWPKSLEMQSRAAHPIFRGPLRYQVPKLLEMRVGMADLNFVAQLNSEAEVA
jgi:hypothetical protein